MEYQLNYAKTKEFKQIFKDYLKGLEQWQKMVSWDTRPEKIVEHRKALKNDLESALWEYKNNKISEARQQMEAIEKRYKNTRNTYADPQAEILRRQDFDMEFETLDRNDIVEMLSDEDRDFSDYELKRIAVTYKGDYKISTLLNNLRVKKDDLYQEDPVYQDWYQEFLFLRQTNSKDLYTVYFPSSTAIVGYEVVNFDTFLSNNQYASTIAEHIEKVTHLLNEIPAIAKSPANELSSVKPVKKMEYKEFDERIFKDHPAYDLLIRFKYLKERFDDTTTDRWNPTRDDYNAYQHYQFLEKRHDLKLNNDDHYRALYEEAERTAIANAEKKLKTIIE